MFRFRKASAIAATAALALAGTGLAGGLASAAPAKATPPPASTGVPAGVEEGTIHLALSCNVLFLIPATLDVTLTGTFPTSVAPGGSWYLTNGHGSITFPSDLTTLATILGGVTAGGSLSSLNFNTTASTPQTVNAAPAAGIAIAQVPITSGQTATVSVPTTGVLPAIGPFTAGSSGVLTVQFGTAAGDINILNSSGSTVFFPFPISCTAPAPAVDIANVQVSSAGSANAQTGAITDPSAPGVPSGDELGTLSTVLSCKVSGTGFSKVFPLTASYSGLVPTDATAGSPVTLTNASGSLVFPTTLVSAAEALGASKGGGDISSLTLGVTDASASTIQLASQPITIAPVTLGKAALTIPIPGPGATLTVPPFTPTAAGESFLSIGTATGTLDLINSANKTIGTLSINCAAPSPQVLLVGITVSAAAASTTTATTTAVAAKS